MDKRNIEISKLSTRYDIRFLTDSDVDEILMVCRGNMLFYRYCAAEATEEQIRSDLHITPSDTDESQKYYVGFYRAADLVAVMDLIDGYPEGEMAYIGFFMVDAAYQGHGVGTGIVSDVIDCLKEIRKSSIRLGIDKGNPQSTRFWKKNGFDIIKESERDGRAVLIAEKAL